MADWVKIRSAHSEKVVHVNLDSVAMITQNADETVLRFRDEKGTIFKTAQTPEEILDGVKVRNVIPDDQTSLQPDPQPEDIVDNG